MIVSPFEIEQTSQNRLPAGTIEDITRARSPFFCGRVPPIKMHISVREFDPLDFRLFTDLCTVLARMIEQQLVELRTRHLIGAIALRAKAVLEIEFHAFRSAGGRDLAAVLRHE